MDFEIDSTVMLVTSGLGVLVNIIMGASLHQHGHSHGGGGGGEHGHGDAEHGHSHDSSSENINVKAAFIHVVGDFLQSLGINHTFIKHLPQLFLFRCFYCCPDNLLQAQLGDS